MDRNLYQEAIDKWGERSQLDMAEEEAAELIIASKNWKRGRGTLDELAEEVADAEIMCGQLRLMVGSDVVDSYKIAKLERLARRIDGLESAKLHPEPCPIEAKHEELAIEAMIGEGNPNG